MAKPFIKNYLIAFINLTVLLGFCITNAHAQNQNYTQAQDLQIKAIQLQQEAVTTINSLPNVSQQNLTSVVQEPVQVAVSVFPITTTLMTPGTVTPRPINRAVRILQPIFFVGTDSLSQQWLQQNLPNLKQLHAMGFLVQAQNTGDADNIQSLASGLTLVPMSGDSFAQGWQLDHYPVLITTQGITQ
jgi:integrating conjugative element protein (TIGR03765 family)